MCEELRGLPNYPSLSVLPQPLKSTILTIIHKYVLLNTPQSKIVGTSDAP